MHVHNLNGLWYIDISNFLHLVVVYGAAYLDVFSEWYRPVVCVVQICLQPPCKQAYVRQGGTHTNNLHTKIGERIIFKKFLSDQGPLCRVTGTFSFRLRMILPMGFMAPATRLEETTFTYCSFILNVKTLFQFHLKLVVPCPLGRHMVACKQTPT